MSLPFLNLLRRQPLALVMAIVAVAAKHYLVVVVVVARNAINVMYGENLDTSDSAHCTGIICFQVKAVFDFHDQPRNAQSPNSK